MPLQDPIPRKTLAAKTTAELQEIWERRAQYPAETVQALRTLLFDRGEASQAKVNRAARAMKRAADTRALADLRATPGPSVFTMAFVGLRAGAGAGAVIGLLYGFLFGVIGYSLNRLLGVTALAGPSGFDMIPIFVGAVIANAVQGAVVAVPYHFLCRVFPRLAGFTGGIGFLLTLWLLARVVGYAIWGLAAIGLYPGNLGVFANVSTLLSALIIGTAIGGAELYEREQHSKDVSDE